ncbi:MAG: PilT/PilU family type 4a pilus ATPase [Pseudomonadota bacterium]
MSLLATLVRQAWSEGASDLHLEPGLPPAVRVRGTLRLAGEPVSGGALVTEARGLAPGELWAAFTERRSLDISRTIAGVRCRLSIFQTQRGVAMAVRLLAPFQATLETLNLHPSVEELVAAEHGLVLVAGPTGSGKSTTLAGLVQAVNQREARHILTLEQPIEYALKPQRSLIRQREVGRDTPSFEQGLLDALREDPDVLVVGELREPATVRLTLDAAETGHLVLATVHAGTATEALQRTVGAFAPEQQQSVCAQLAGCLVGVLCQRLSYRPELGIRVPVLEILRGTEPVKALIRQNQLARLVSAITTGGAEGMWTFERYQRWLDARERFFVPAARAAAPEDEEPTPATRLPPARPAPSHRPAQRAPAADGVIELDAHEDLASILAELDRR